MGAFFISINNYQNKKGAYEKQETISRSDGWACHQTVVCTDADGGPGTEDGADGEADNELCVSVELGALGTEAGIGLVEGKP